MGYIKHNAMVFTSGFQENIIKVHEKAVEIFKKHDEVDDYNRLYAIDKLISPIMEGVMNKYYSFFIAPDGSKEGFINS